MTKSFALNRLVRASRALYGSAHDPSASRDLIRTLDGDVSRAVLEARAYDATEVEVNQAIMLGHAEATDLRERNARRAA